MKLVTFILGSYRLLFSVWAVQHQHSQANSMWGPQRPFRTSGSQFWNGTSSRRKDDNKASQHTSTAFRELDICRTNMFNWFNWTSQSCGSRKIFWKKDETNVQTMEVHTKSKVDVNADKGNFPLPVALQANFYRCLVPKVATAAPNGG